MTVASALTSLNQDIQNARTAITNKGGTVTSGGGSSQLATDISSIPSGGGSQTKYGITIDTFLGDVDANGVLQYPSEQADLVFTGVEDVADYGLRYKFAYSGVKSASFPALTEVSGQYGCDYMFQQSTGLTSMSLPELTTVSGRYGCNYMFSNTGLTSVSLPKLATVSGQFGCNSMFSNTGLTSVSLPKLATVSGNYGCNYMFSNCRELVSVSFPKLADVSGTSTFTGAFGSCRNLTDIYFNALTTTSFGSNVNQFNNIFNSGSTGTASTSGNVTVHFPSNLSSTISGLTGYPNFGATAGRLTLAYDLPATS
jgi:hypothetical protein